MTNQLLSQEFSDLELESTHHLQAIQLVQQAVAQYYGITIPQLLSESKTIDLSIPRQVAMYLARHLTDGTFQEIQKAFQKRSHGTVIHACKTVENLIDQDEVLRKDIEFLINSIA